MTPWALFSSHITNMPSIRRRHQLWTTIVSIADSGAGETLYGRQVGLPGAGPGQTAWPSLHRPTAEGVSSDRPALTVSSLGQNTISQWICSTSFINQRQASSTPIRRHRAHSPELAVRSLSLDDGRWRQYDTVNATASRDQLHSRSSWNCIHTYTIKH